MSGILIKTLNSHLNFFFFVSLPIRLFLYTLLTGSLDAAEARVPPVYITKYNRYVDTILERVNKVLRNGYDPVNVRLHTVKSNNNNKKGQGKKKNKNKGKKPGKKGGKGKKKNKNKNKNKNNKRNRLQEEAIARAIT